MPELMFSQDELYFVELLKDEVKWAYAEFGWEARWYQSEILHAQSNRMVLRMGRRTGKTDSACIRMLHRAYTKPGRKIDESYVILVLTPFETQIEAIFKRFRELINMSATLKSSVVGDTKNPQEIRFANGSRVTGYTTGASSGKGASNVRGQRGDFLYLDECDYMSDADINTVLAIALEDPERIEILATSTPSGRRSHFYRWCVNAPTNGWKQFHFPSNVNPTWTDHTEKEFREALSELAYLQEIGAEFGEEAAGVYAKKHLDASYAFAESVGYVNYPTTPYDKLGPRMVGIDWDVVQATPTLVGVEWWPEWNRFRVFMREQMPKTEFTLDYAVNQIIRLNALWDFDAVICDRGLGEFQVETLKKHGITYPQTGLAEKTIGYSLSEKVEVRDPHSKQIEKKMVKPFMVNCSVVALERSQLVLCPGDKQMKKQLEDYHVVRVSQNGNPIYVDHNEHMVDSLNLAVMQMMLTHDSLFRVTYATAVRYVPPARQDAMRDMTTEQPDAPSMIRIIGGKFAPVMVPRRTGGNTSTGRFRTLL